jgi:superfamily I DNA/RNA helicase
MGNWTVPPPKLDTEQRNFLEKYLPTGKNFWISGFPGSGKSTLLAHAIRVIKADKPKATILLVVFTRSLIEMFEAAFKEMNIAGIQIKTMFEFMRSGRHYDYILCDEVQDLTPEIISCLRSHSSCAVVAGDENQSIWDIDPKGNKTVNPASITTLVNGELFKLTIVHRLSPSIQNAIQRLIPTLGNLSRLTNMADHQTQIRLCSATTIQQETEYIWKEAVKAPKIGKTSAILVPTQQAAVNFVNRVLSYEKKTPWTLVSNEYGKVDFGSMNDYLRSQGVQIQHVGNGYGNFNISNCVYMMTYHSAKGLDFDNVFLPGINDRMYITPNPELSKRVFMVAMTRSRNNLYMCYTGVPHPYVKCVSSDPKNYISVDINQSLNPVTTGPIGF